MPGKNVITGSRMRTLYLLCIGLSYRVMVVLRSHTDIDPTRKGWRTVKQLGIEEFLADCFAQHNSYNAWYQTIFLIQYLEHNVLGYLINFFI